MPWPVQLSQAYDQQDPSLGRWMDGFMMLGALFTDFTGDLNFALADETILVIAAIQKAEMYETWKKQEGVLCRSARHWERGLRRPQHRRGPLHTHLQEGEDRRIPVEFFRHESRR